MDLNTALKKLESSKVFKDFKKENTDYELAHAFTMIEKVQGPWQIGYYSSSKDRIVVFDVDKHISKSPEEEVFKQPGRIVQKLDMKKVKMNVEQAVAKAESFAKEQYPKEITNRVILILQNLDKPVYNITLTTETFNMINMHIDAENCGVETCTIQSILSLKRDDM